MEEDKNLIVIGFNNSAELVAHLKEVATTEAEFDEAFDELYANAKDSVKAKIKILWETADNSAE